LGSCSARPSIGAWHRTRLGDDRGSLRHRTSTIAGVIELGHLTDRKPPFRYAAYLRVGFSETDAQGVVYYGRYMPYFDTARTEYHRHLGRPELGGADFAMRASTVEYHAPARFDDLLEVFVRIERIGRTSITYDLAAYRIDDAEGTADLLMATAKQTLVLIDLQERNVAPVPDAFRARIAAFEGATFEGAAVGGAAPRGPQS
jgi:acyl-CoA thioester hydrolase